MPPLTYRNVHDGVCVYYVPIIILDVPSSALSAQVQPFVLWHLANSLVTVIVMGGSPRRLYGGPREPQRANSVCYAIPSPCKACALAQVLPAEFFGSVAPKAFRM